MSDKVVIGMSGGVDSSVAALMLKDEGYDVIGLFMRNWHEEDDCGRCSAEEDFSDVRRVADKIGIPYYTIDFSREYLDRVFTHFIEEYKKGRTPNPDVLCNREIKFDAFSLFAQQTGAKYIATGHYAKVRHEKGKSFLLRSADENKDQTYFLNQITQEQLSNALFPLGDILKPQVREIAHKAGLSTAAKKDSTGICFIGERRFRKFLSDYIPMKQGDIVTEDGKIVGRHEGVFYYTKGQRKGLGVGGGGNGEPYFILDKDVEKNLLIVSQGESSRLYSSWLKVDKFHYIGDKLADGEHKVTVRIRHRQPLQEAVAEVAGESVTIRFIKKQRAVASGQYAVMYIGEECLGGGVIEEMD